MGVADFFGVAFFAADFLTGAFFVVAGVFDFVTRPDLVLPRILGSSTTAGACYHVSQEPSIKAVAVLTGAAAVLAVFFVRGFAVLALVVVLVLVVFLVAGAFFVAAAVFVVFFGAAFFVGVVVLGLGSLTSFCHMVSNKLR